MGAPKFSEFELLLLRSKNELGTSILLILAWIAASDGSIDEAEVRQLADISEASKHGHRATEVLQLAKTQDLDALQLATEIVRNHFRGEKAALFLEMAVGMAVADGYLLSSENYILRFLADALGVSAPGLSSLFVEATGRDIPDPSDPSSAQYWKSREQQREKSRQGPDSSHRRASAPSNDQRAIHCFAVLGLEVGANKDEIKRAYRRLAQIHHPDRFTSLGDESIAAATLTFQRIQAAHDYLMKNA